MNKAVSTKVVKEGPVVAVQYPSTVDYTVKKGVGKELATKYGHLKQIDPDNKDLYAELKAAIKDVKTQRTDNQKEEDVVKAPLNKFRALVIKTGQSVREEIQEVETTLTDEKQRIDDIKAERLEAQRKLWNENLQINFY